MELTLEDGRTVVDVGSMSSCILGHCHPEVAAAVEQAARTIYANDGSGYRPRERAVEDLLQLAFRDEPWADAVALFVSSSEAADLGLLLAQMLRHEHFEFRPAASAANFPDTSAPRRVWPTRRAHSQARRP
jgi:4-aminobutyrate aminotransferase-like enzyme